MNLIEKAKLAKESALKLSILTSKVKDSVLIQIADKIDASRKEIFSENQKDLDEAEKNNLEQSLVKRLKLTDAKIDEMVNGLKDLAKLEDPVGKTLETLELDEGLELFKVTTPIGVIGSVFESRPDAMVQIFSLCFKSGNASFLKGGSEAKNSNRFLHSLITKITDAVAKDASILLETREDVAEILKMNEHIDLIIPRGSNKFVKFIMENTRIPVIGHADGICHSYVDKEVDLEMAYGVCFDAKCQYSAVCNAIETLLIHKDIASKFLPKMAEIYREADVELRGCEKTRAIVDMNKAIEDDWDTEYNDLIISIKIVEDVDEAIKHINEHGSGHSELIVTENAHTAKKFLEEVDASSVMWNCSTRFADGYRYGKGAETGISTGKIHARGPVGLEGLVIYKYLLKGKGHKVADYSGDNSKAFTHKKINKKWEG